MGSILTFISIVTIIFGLILRGNALNSKSDLEKVFLTHEQKLKMYYYNLFVLSGLMAFIGTMIYIVWKVYIKKGTTILEMNDWSSAIALAIIIFVCCLFSLGSILRLIEKVFIKHHFKYKVNLTNVGEVYILGMMNPDVCICSKDPNTNWEMSTEASFLIKLDTVMQQPLIKMRILKPQQSFLQKLIN